MEPNESQLYRGESLSRHSPLKILESPSHISLLFKYPFVLYILESLLTWIMSKESKWGRGGGALSLNIGNPSVAGTKSHISFVKHNTSKEVKKSKQLTINEVF